MAQWKDDPDRPVDDHVFQLLADRLQGRAQRFSLGVTAIFAAVGLTLEQEHLLGDAINGIAREWRARLDSST